MIYLCTYRSCAGKVETRQAATLTRAFCIYYLLTRLARPGCYCSHCVDGSCAPQHPATPPVTGRCKQSHRQRQPRTTAALCRRVSPHRRSGSEYVVVREQCLVGQRELEAARAVLSPRARDILRRCSHTGVGLLFGKRHRDGYRRTKLRAQERR